MKSCTPFRLIVFRKALQHINPITDMERVRNWKRRVLEHWKRSPRALALESQSDLAYQRDLPPVVTDEQQRSLDARCAALDELYSDERGIPKERLPTIPEASSRWSLEDAGKSPTGYSSVNKATSTSLGPVTYAVSSCEGIPRGRSDVASSATDRSVGQSC